MEQAVTVFFLVTTFSEKAPLENLAGLKVEGTQKNVKISFNFFFFF